MRRAFGLLGVLALSLVVGCGGGGGSSVTGPTETVSAGSVEVTGTNLATAAYAPGSTLYAVTGNISGAIYNDLSPTLAETEVYYCWRDDFSNWRLGAVLPFLEDGVAASFGDGSVRFINDIVGTPVEMRVDPQGNWVYLTLQTTTRRLYRYPAFGGPRQLISSDCNAFAFTPSGSQIVFTKASTGNELWRMNPDGSNLKQIGLSMPSTFDSLWGCVSEDIVRGFGIVTPTPGTTVGQSVIDVQISTGTVFQNGTGVSIGRVGLAQNGSCQWGFLNDGSWRLFRSIGRSLNPDDLTFAVTPNYASNHLDICPSPDGSRAIITTNAPGGQLGRVTDGTSNTVLFGEQQVGEVAWGPYIRSRIFAGSGPFVGGSGAILFSENGEVLPVVVAADAVTRNSCVITRVSADGAKNTVYRLDCDNLSKLYYGVSPVYSYRPLVLSATGLKGAFISFSSESGKLVSVVTFAGSPNTSATADGVVVEGDLTSQLDGERQIAQIKL